MNPVLFDSLQGSSIMDPQKPIFVRDVNMISGTSIGAPTHTVQDSGDAKNRTHVSRYILVFDTETTGLFPKASNTSGDSLVPNNERLYPYIIQLCFIVYDMESNTIIRQYNKHINIPGYVVISPFITNLTGITREMCDSGVSIISALHHFYSAYKLCDTIVAHNLAFDKQMIELEIIRNNSKLKTIPLISFMFNETFRILKNKQFYCTMIMSRNICNLMVPSKTNPLVKYKKNPKLEELYEFLFQEKIVNAHDALFDTIACLRCFVKISEGSEMRSIGTPTDKSSV